MAVLKPEMIPPQFREDAGRFPPVLRALLHAELAAGNAIVSSGFHFPACPAGCFFILAKPVTTRARASADGLKFYQYSRSDYSGSFTDEGGMFFLLEPPLPTEPERDMDAIRAAHAPSSTALPPLVLSEPGTALGRFEQSMV